MDAMHIYRVLFDARIFARISVGLMLVHLHLKSTKMFVLVGLSLFTVNGWWEINPCIQLKTRWSVYLGMQYNPRLPNHWVQLLFVSQIKEFVLSEKIFIDALILLELTCFDHVMKLNSITMLLHAVFLTRSVMPTFLKNKKTQWSGSFTNMLVKSSLIIFYSKGNIVATLHKSRNHSLFLFLRIVK